MCVCVCSGLQTEGLLHRHSGPSPTHGGGLLEDGVGMEVSLHCHAHRAPGEGAGKQLKSSYNHLPKATRLISCSGILGQMLPILAHRGLCCLRRLQGRAERRHFVRHFQSTRLGTDICAGKKIPSALTSAEIKMHLCCLVYFYPITRTFTCSVMSHPFLCAQTLLHGWFIED